MSSNPLSLRERLQNLTKDQLKAELKKFNARQQGNKAELVELLACLIEREKDVTYDPSKGIYNF